MQLLDLDRSAGVWRIHEASRLPKIDHGDTENSVKILGSLTIENLVDDEGRVVTQGDVAISGNLTVGGDIVADTISLHYGTDSDGAAFDGYATILKVSASNQLQFWTKPKTK